MSCCNWLLTQRMHEQNSPKNILDHEVRSCCVVCTIMSCFHFFLFTLWMRSLQCICFGCFRKRFCQTEFVQYKLQCNITKNQQLARYQELEATKSSSYTERLLYGEKCNRRDHIMSQPVNLQYLWLLQSP